MANQKKMITKEQLEKYIVDLVNYQGELQTYINGLVSTAKDMEAKNLRTVPGGHPPPNPPH